METPKIFESEYRFCLILWEHEPIKSSELVSLCREQLGWKPTTTYTVIKRLSERGVLKNENTIVSALVTKDEIQAAEINEMVEKTFEGSLPAFVAAFAGRKKLSDKEIDELRNIMDNGKGILADIEARIAEIFREKVPSPMMVITYGIVRNTMNQIGSPENFGVASRPLNEQTHQQNTNRLYRSRKDRSIAGICSGIAKYFGLDTTLVRIAAILCIFFAGATLWIYLILWLVLPYEPEA